MKMSTQDAIYNWLMIKIVIDNRPNDEAAIETAEWFSRVLQEDHQISDISYEKTDDACLVSYIKNQEKRTMQFPVEMAEMILNHIDAHPDQFKIYSE